MAQSDFSQPLRVALVGCGEVCEHKHLPALHRVTDLRVVALVDPDPRRLDKVGARYGIAARLADPESLVDEDRVDVIGVLVPPAAHCEIAATAVQAGHHVLIEKPISLSLDEADLLVEIARRAPTKIQMGFHMRWHRLLQRARQSIRAGAIGTPESIRTTWSSPRADAGIPAWKTRRSAGGGAIVELGVHLFDLWRFLLETTVLDVFALSRHGRRQDESAIVSASLANGVLASATVSERASHEIEVEISGDRGRIRVACQRFDGFELYARDETRGMLGPRLRGFVELARQLPRGLKTMRQLGDYGDSYRAQWQGFADAIRANRTPECTVEDGRLALQVVLAASASADRKERVRVNDAPRALAGELALQDG